MTACTSSDDSPVPRVEEMESDTVVLAEPDAGTREVLTGSEAQASVRMSAALFEQSPVAVVFARQAETGYTSTDADLGPAATAAAGLQTPLLVLGPGPDGAAEVTGELDRLGVETVIAYGDPAADWTAVSSARELLAGPTEEAGFDEDLGLGTTAASVPAADFLGAVVGLGDELTLLQIEADDPATEQPAPSGAADPGAGLEDLATTTELPEFRQPEGSTSALVLATAASSPASLVTARAARAQVQVLADGDPRSSSDSVRAVHDGRDAAIYAVGGAFGGQPEFAARVAVAATGAELPGGGQTVFPGRRMVALYGHPSGPYLGALGEQGIEATMTRVTELAARYQPFSDEPVIPALDLIATVASADPGPAGDYSARTSIEELEPWVDAAEAAGIYVVLDLQSGRSDFLSQARQYEELLARPTVGLALDPEWRLAPGQVPLQQIGTVDAAEINEVSTWLADLTRDRALPQKLLMVHQFRIDMINDREDLDVSRTELSVTLHADGHGTPGQKLDTWNVLQQVPPEGIWPSWKNFYDEDEPMLTPEQTYTMVDPKPWLVTYQ